MQDVLIKNVNKYRFCGWKYNGYVARLNSVDAFYKHNLALLQPAVQQDLFNSAHPIYTKSRMRCPRITAAAAVRATALLRTAALSRVKSKIPYFSAEFMSARVQKSKTAY